MSHHIEDGRVWAVDSRTGEKRRVMPHVIPHSKYLSLTPSERNRQRITEPRHPVSARRDRRVSEPEQPEDLQAVEPAQESEPDTHPKPADRSGETSEKES